MDYPYQSEDGRDLAPIQQKLADKCIELSELPYWSFTNCCTDSLQLAAYTLTKDWDYILVPAYGWRGVANAMKFMNRRVKFIDIDKNTFSINLDTIFKPIILSNFCTTLLRISSLIFEFIL